MMPVNKQEITKDMIEKLLKELANKYQKIDKAKYQSSDIVIVGGGSILLNYGFRESTIDIDAIIHVSSAIKDIAIDLSKKYNISPHWLNSDFTILSSYSPRLEEVSKHYKSYNHGRFNIRTINAEYLIAMKMQAGRLYNNDLPDIIGVLATEKQNGNNLSYDKIIKALHYLYNDKLTVQEEFYNRVKKYCEMTPEQLWKEYEKVKEQTKLVNAEIIQNKDKIKEKSDAKEVGMQIFNKIINNGNNINDPELRNMVIKGKNLGLPNDIIKQMSKTFELMEEEQTEKEINNFINKVNDEHNQSIDNHMENNEVDIEVQNQEEANVGENPTHE